MAQQQILPSIFEINFRTRTVALISLVTLAGVFTILPTAQAQTLNVLYSFTGGLDGSSPWGQLAVDQAGNLYTGTMEGGNNTGSGAAIKLKSVSGSWLLQPLYDFNGGNDDGIQPQVVVASDGTVFGATQAGGPSGCGIVFQLTPSSTPPSAALARGNETVLHTFAGGSDGCNPFSAPIIDSAGNLYGTTADGGGPNDAGVVYELVRSGQSYTEQILYTFSGPDGAVPGAGLIADSSFTNLYGVTQVGGSGNAGTVFRLTNNGSSWTETVLYNFHNSSDGQQPQAGLAMDAAGNLYGSAGLGGNGGGGTVFELTPSGGSYTFRVIYSLQCNYPSCIGPYLGYLTLDPAGNVYGTTLNQGAHTFGSVFELTPDGGGYTFTDLHDFSLGSDDGGFPDGGVIRDAAGNLYGTAVDGGTYGGGIIFQITPSQSPK
jgi:uncharacterized repeat protein (TIGR03803 family)